MSSKLQHRNIFAATVGSALIAGVAVMPTASAQLACEGLGGTVDANQVCQVHTATPSYKFDASFPLDYPDQQAVTDFLTQNRADFLDWITKFGGEGRSRQYEHDVTAKTYQSSGTHSLVLAINDDTGFAHEDHSGTSYRAFNYDLNKHAPITFDTLFKPDADPLAVLNPIVHRELGTPVSQHDALSYQNFAITEDAVIFFFGEDQVVADNNGPHRISVPRSELVSLLA
jgi:hypothetical protein